MDPNGSATQQSALNLGNSSILLEPVTLDGRIFYRIYIGVSRADVRSVLLAPGDVVEIVNGKSVLGLHLDDPLSSRRVTIAP